MVKRNKSEIIGRFIVFKIIEITVLILILSFFYYLGYFTFGKVTGTELVDKCNFKDIGTDRIWCEGFIDWLVPHISLFLLGVGALFFIILIITGLFNLIKWNWRMAKS